MAKMKLADDTGTTLTQAIDSTLQNLMLDYDISRAQARKLLAECLIRNCVLDEIEGTANWLLGIHEDE